MDKKEESPSGAVEMRRATVESTGYFFVRDDDRAAGPAPLLLGLHGYGQTGPDFLELMVGIASAEMLVASAQGFNQIWHPKSGRVTFSWMTAFEKQDSIERNDEYLNVILDSLEREGRTIPGKTILLGFSQGSSVALRFARRNPRRVAGVISVCADLPPDVEADLTPLKSVAVLVVYGTKDAIVPVEKPVHAIHALEAGGVDVTPLEFDRGHLVPASSAPEIQDWMRRVLDSSSDHAAAAASGT